MFHLEVYFGSLFISILEQLPHFFLTAVWCSIVGIYHLCNGFPPVGHSGYLKYSTNCAAISNLLWLSLGTHVSYLYIEKELLSQNIYEFIIMINIVQLPSLDFISLYTVWEHLFPVALPTDQIFVFRKYDRWKRVFQFSWLGLGGGEQATEHLFYSV